MMIRSKLRIFNNTALTSRQLTASSDVSKVSILLRLGRPLIKTARILCLSSPFWFVGVQVANAESWKVNLQDADIKAFINEVATIT